MTVKASRALKAALAIGAVAVLSLSLVAMSGCSSSDVKGHATKNVYAEPVASVTPEDCSGTLDAVSYINYTLAQKDSWHCYKQTYSTATLTTVTTTTYKDYSDGVLVAEELVYGTGFGSGSSQSHQFMFITSPEEDRCVYVRSGSKPGSADDGPDEIEWDEEDVECWSEDYYNTKFGLFMDEISLYVLNEETLLGAEVDEEEPEEIDTTAYEIQTLADDDGNTGEGTGDDDDNDDDDDEQDGEETGDGEDKSKDETGDGEDETGDGEDETGDGEDETEDGEDETEDGEDAQTNSSCGPVINNGDGTYSQTFQLDTVMSTYYYSYSMMTHGSLSSAPDFDSVDVTFTFNANWEILKVEENDVSTGLTGSTCKTTTEYSYDESDFDETTYAAGIAFFEPYMGTLEMVDIETDETEEDEAGEGESKSAVKQYEKNLTLTVVMAIVVGVVIVLGIILTGVGCSAGGKKKNAQQGEDEEKKN